MLTRSLGKSKWARALEKMTEPFDLIFFDFAKKLYAQAFELCLPLLEKGGVFIIDNINANSCSEFKDTLLRDNRFKTEIIEIGDGLSCAVKL